MKTYYGKEKSNFTNEEKKVFNIDLGIFALMHIADHAEGIEGLMFQISGGIEKIEKTFISRTIFIGMKIMGMNEPTSQEEYTALENAVEESNYKFETQNEILKVEFAEFQKANNADPNAPIDFKTFLDSEKFPKEEEQPKE